MGRGNVCTHGKYEGLYYIDYENFACYATDENGNETKERCYEIENDLLQFDLEAIKDSLIKKYPSFCKIEKSMKEGTAILENNLFYIVIEDNQWSLAIKLIQKEASFYDNYNKNNLQKKHYLNYLEGLKEVLFELYDTIGIYGGAWTSGIIKR